jgi:competence protein ComFC
MGELVYQLKYRQDKSNLPAIVALLDTIKGIEQFNYIIPIPPTDNSRAFQPVNEIALALVEPTTAWTGSTRCRCGGRTSRHGK